MYKNILRLSILCICVGDIVPDFCIVLSFRKQTAQKFLLPLKCIISIIMYFWIFAYILYNSTSFSNYTPDA